MLRIIDYVCITYAQIWEKNDLQLLSTMQLLFPGFFVLDLQNSCFFTLKHEESSDIMTKISLSIPFLSSNPTWYIRVMGG